LTPLPSENAENAENCDGYSSGNPGNAGKSIDTRLFPARCAFPPAVIFRPADATTLDTVSFVTR